MHWRYNLQTMTTTDDLAVRCIATVGYIIFEAIESNTLARGRYKLQLIHFRETFL